MAYGNGGTAALGGALTHPNALVSTAPPTQITISNALDDQHQSLVMLHEVLTDLEQRLDTVLGPTSPKSEAAGSPLSSAAVLHRVSEHNYGIRAARDRVVALLERLHL